MEKRLIFLDTETTGNMPPDRLCQIAFKVDDETFSGLYRPPVPITIESMAVHHITEKMVADKKAFIGSPEFEELQKIFETDAVFVAHNAKFDMMMLEKEGLKPKTFIDTYRVARHLDTEGKIPSYRLQYLRYLLGIEIDAVAHDAMGDVLVLEKLFDRLLKKIMETENLSRDTAIEAMIDISSHPVLFKFFNFGKYKNQSIDEVAKNDPGYLRWLLEQKKQNPEEEEDWIYTLEHFLKM